MRRSSLDVVITQVLGVIDNRDSIAEFLTEDISLK
jgi:hypothetical protein